MKIKLKLFGGNRENKLKKKEWEAREGLRRYKNLTDPGTDMGGNAYGRSEGVKEKITTLTKNPGEARKTYRNIKDWGRKEYQGIRDLAETEIFKSNPVAYQPNPYKSHEVVGNLVNEKLNEKQISRINSHQGSQKHTYPKTITTSSPSIKNKTSEIISETLQQSKPKRGRGIFKRIGKLISIK